MWLRKIFTITYLEILCLRLSDLIYFFLYTITVSCLTRCDLTPLPHLLWFPQWKKKATGRSPAAETVLRSGLRSPGRPARPSRTTSWPSWSAASSGRSTWASRTAWNSQPRSTWPIRRSRPGTRTEGKYAHTHTRTTAACDTAGTQGHHVIFSLERKRAPLRASRRASGL